MTTLSRVHQEPAAKGAASAFTLQRKCRDAGRRDGYGCSSCRTDQDEVRRKTQRGSDHATVPASVHETLAEAGQPLEASARSFMEQRFRQDFSAVRVHTGSAAAQSARDIDALAYTVGNRIVFDAGRYAPNTADGRSLLAHELTHTLQQGMQPPARSHGRAALLVGAANDSLERAADAQAARIGAGDPGGSHSAGLPARSGIVQREPRPEPAPVPTPEPAPALPKCGPDATDWFVLQVNTAMADPAVLATKASLRVASVHAAHLGLTVAQLGEAGGVVATLREESKLGTRAPTRTADASAQIKAGVGSAAMVASAAFAALKSPGHAAAMTFALANAALGWKALVNHGARYDFKAHTMNHPLGASCPDDGCPQGAVGIITLCPGKSPQNCYESDMPGNIFYALIGRFIGWSEITLQLGSQYAELTDAIPRPTRPAVTWDTPDDTAAIALGFHLPLPLSRGALCASIGPARPVLAARHGCQDCPDPTTAAIR